MPFRGHCRMLQTSVRPHNLNKACHLGWRLMAISSHNFPWSTSSHQPHWGRLANVGGPLSWGAAPTEATPTWSHSPSWDHPSSKREVGVSPDCCELEPLKSWRLILACPVMCGALLGLTVMNAMHLPQQLGPACLVHGWPDIIFSPLSLGHVEDGLVVGHFPGPFILPKPILDPSLPRPSNKFAFGCCLMKPPYFYH